MKTKTKRQIVDLPTTEGDTSTVVIASGSSLEMTMLGVTDDQLLSLDFVKINGVKFWNPSKE